MTPSASEEPRERDNGVSASLSWGAGPRVTVRAVGVFAVVLLLWIGQIAATLFSGWQVQLAVGAIQSRQVLWEERVREKWSQDRASDDTLACMVVLSPEQREAARRVETRESLRQFCRWLGR